jgi:hypothetical protein
MEPLDPKMLEVYKRKLEELSTTLFKQVCWGGFFNWNTDEYDY